MFIPLVSSWLESDTHTLERRKGGGHGGGKGGGSSSKGGGAKSSSSSSKGASISIKSPLGTTANVKAYGSGVTKVNTIPSGQPFAGRSTGGAVRSSVFGTRAYGSGYPGTQTSEVAGRGFPFGFWPVTFGAGVGLGAGSQYRTHEYGEPSNSSRPGGPLVHAPFQPRNGTNTYRILADSATVTSLISSIRSNCTLNTTTFISPVPYNGNDSTQPKPEQVIQYYRASSIALTLDGYNNSAVFSNSSTPDTPLPSNLDATFLACLNQTIGAAAPLLDNAATSRAQISGLVGLAWMAFYFLRWCS